MKRSDRTWLSLLALSGVYWLLASTAASFDPAALHKAANRQASAEVDALLHFK